MWIKLFTYFTAWMKKMIMNFFALPRIRFDVISIKTSTFSRTVKKSLIDSSVSLIASLGSPFSSCRLITWSLKSTIKLDSVNNPSVTILLSVTLPKSGLEIKFYYIGWNFFVLYPKRSSWDICTASPHRLLSPSCWWWAPHICRTEFWI